MTTTKCDIIRDFANDVGCGMCTAISMSPPLSPPDRCNKNSIPPLCFMPTLLNTKMAYDMTKLTPPSTARTKKLEVMKNIIDQSTDVLKYKYPNALPGATDISWSDLEFCRSGGTKSAPKYFTKEDAERLGFSPNYPIGGTLLQGKIFKKKDPIPMKVNYLINSDLFVIIVFAFLVLLFIALLRAAKRTSLIERREKTAKSINPELFSKCKKYITEMEKRNYDMTAYREKCGVI
jgi:hypothetical protein